MQKFKEDFIKYNILFIKKIFIFSALIFYLASPAYSDTKFKPGQKYSGFIQLDNDSKELQIPLPPGIWTISAVKLKDRSSQGNRLADVYLFNAENKKLKNAMRILYLYENGFSKWRVPPKCDDDQNLFNMTNTLYVGDFDCYYIRPTAIVTKKKGAGRDSITYMQSQGLTIPLVIPGVTYFRSLRDMFLSVSYYENPLENGMTEVKAASFSSNDYAVSKINQFAKKKAYVKDLENWAKEWWKLVDLGFNGKLTSKIMGKPIFINAAQKEKKENVDIKSRLKKIKSLEELGLITKEEAAEKRKTILDSL